IEYNETNEEFQKHILDYFDDVTKKNEGPILFSEGHTITTPQINPNFKFNVDSFLKPSRLGSSQTTNIGWGISGLFGLEITILLIDGFHKTTQSKTENITFGPGLHYSENYSAERGMVNLMDINGDGQKDLIVRTSSGIKYYPQTVQRTQNFNGE